MYLPKMELIIPFLKKFEKVSRISNACSAHFMQQDAVNFFSIFYIFSLPFPRNSIKHHKPQIQRNILPVWGLPGGLVVKNTPAKAGNADSIPGQERSPGERNCNPLQYSCLRKTIGRGVWQSHKELDTTEHTCKLHVLKFCILSTQRHPKNIQEEKLVSIILI